MQKESCEYVYCYGCSNYMEKGVDPLLLGILHHDDDKDLMFKCTDSVYDDEDLSRIVWKKTPKNRYGYW